MQLAPVPAAAIALLVIAVPVSCLLDRDGAFEGSPTSSTSSAGGVGGTIDPVVGGNVQTTGGFGGEPAGPTVGGGGIGGSGGSPPTGLRFRKALRIDGAEVEAPGGNGTLADFTVLVDITDDELMGKLQADADDIRFEQAGGVPLPYELVSFQGNRLIAWVLLPSISEMNNQQTEFFLLYSDPQAINGEDPDNTWPTSYQLVMHMDDGTASDASGNNRNGTLDAGTAAPVAAPGMIGGGLELDSDSGIDVGMFDIGNDATISAWVRVGNDSVSQRIFGNQGNMCSSDDGYGLMLAGGSDRYRFQAGEMSNCGTAESNNQLASLNNWQHVAVRFSRATSSAEFYLDGQAETSDGDFSLSAWPTGGQTAIGRAIGGGEHFIGVLDELHVRDRRIPPEQLETEYNNQSDPSAFISVGPEMANP